MTLVKVPLKLDRLAGFWEPNLIGLSVSNMVKTNSKQHRFT